MNNTKSLPSHLIMYTNEYLFIKLDHNVLLRMLQELVMRRILSLYIYSYVNIEIVYLL
jgi:hypothetical protein